MAFGGRARSLRCPAAQIPLVYFFAGQSGINL